jgi:hypothetical protein
MFRLIYMLLFVTVTISFVALGLPLNEAARCRIDSDMYAVPAYVPGFCGEGKNGPVPNMIPLDTGRCVKQDQFRPVLDLVKHHWFEERVGRR